MGSSNRSGCSVMGRVHCLDDQLRPGESLVFSTGCLLEGSNALPSTRSTNVFDIFCGSSLSRSMRTVHLVGFSGQPNRSRTALACINRLYGGLPVPVHGLQFFVYRCVHRGFFVPFRRASTVALAVFIHDSIIRVPEIAKYSVLTADADGPESHALSAVVKQTRQISGLATPARYSTVSS